jgi:hypothetical protein
MGTAAITDTNQAGNFTVKRKHFKNNMLPSIMVGGIAGAETVSLYYLVGAVWEPATDSSGTAIVYTADDNIDAVSSPGEYGFIKDLTAGAITIYLEDGT